MSRIVGIDPGLSGAMTLIDTTDWTMQIFDMPLEPSAKGKNATSPVGVAKLVTQLQPDHCVIEHVTASPQMGTTSAFNFGQSYGILLGAAASRAMLHLVRPQVWKLKTNTPKDKNQARSRARQLFPCASELFARVKDDGRAESALLAFYGLLSLGMSPQKLLTLKQ